MSEFVIENNIPVPEAHSKGIKKYPFDAMKVGDSFAFDAEKSSTVSRAGIAYGKRHGMKFRVREGRIWRVA